MSKVNDRLRLKHMLTFAKKAKGFAAGRKRADLDSDELFALALARLVELIGEAASRVSAEGRARYPMVNWKDVIGMRHHLIHGYDQMDLNMVWQTVVEDLDPLIRALESGPPIEESP